MKYYFPLLLLFILPIFSSTVHAQTLVAGDIAFIGYHEDATDQFTWIALKDIPAGEEIYFTEKGWNATGSSWFITTEGHMRWVSPAGGVSCGTIVHINETAGNTFTVTGGGTATIALNSWSQSGGDQVLAYQGGAGVEPGVPVFIAGVHADYNSGDYNATTTWNNGNFTNVTSASMQPTGLTNLVDCISLHPAPGPEYDCTHYDGTLTGTAAALRTLINNPANWGINQSNAAIDITASAFPVPSVTCTPPVNPEIDIEGNTTSIPDGDVTPSLGDDTDFGTVVIGATATNTFTIQNEGTSDLTLSGGPTFVTLTGSSLFTVTAQPSSPISAAGSTTFSIQFSASCPNTASTYNATVSVSSDDADESPYTFDITADITGVDTDSDGALDLCDPDDDNDGIADGSDPDDTDFNVCGDSDSDGCDDCSVTNDGFGALSDSDPNNDGTDSDCDGICDATDPTDNASMLRGNMLTFDGGGDFVSLGDIPELNFGKASSFTIEAWINTATGGDIDIISKYGGLFGTGWVLQHQSSTNSLGFVMQGAFLDMFFAAPAGDPLVADGLWHHVAVTYDGSNAATGCTFYVDGVAYPGVALGGLPGPIAGTVTNTNSATIGAYELGGPAEFWNGSMDEVRVWDDIRTQTEIRENMHLTIPGTCIASNVGYWKFNEPSGFTTADISGHGNAGTHMGAPLIVSSEASVAKGVSTTHNAVATATVYATPSLYAGESLDITFPSTAPGGEMVVSYLNQIPVGGVPAGALAEFSSSHWIVNNYGPTNAGLGSELLFRYSDGGITSVSLATYNLQKRGSRETGAWTLSNSFANAASTIPGNNYIQFNPINNFSMFFPSSGISPLPVELLSFSVERIGSTASLNWATASEFENAGFEIQRSTDAESWTKIGFVNGMVTSQSLTNYSFDDRSPADGMNYYRLKQIDLDGVFRYSDIKSALFNSVVEGLTVYPNPNDGEFTILLSGFDTDQILTLNVRDVNGREVMSTRLGSLNKSIQSTSIHLDDAQPGMYYLTVTDGHTTKKQKIVIK